MSILFATAMIAFWMQRGDNYFGQGIVKNVMIFPVQEKYVSKNPYHELDSLLRLRLEKSPVCIVVGHAFNDEAILHAFVDSMMRNMALRLILLSHSPEKIVREKSPLILRERVIPAKCKSLGQETSLNYSYRSLFIDQ